MVRANRKKGFTIIELVVVMTIILLLAGLVAAAAQTARQKAMIARTKAMIAAYRHRHWVVQLTSAVSSRAATNKPSLQLPGSATRVRLLSYRYRNFLFPSHTPTGQGRT
jgi:prepilin-type N-terminal cleavage/methylation domain-containing protein